MTSMTCEQVQEQLDLLAAGACDAPTQATLAYVVTLDAINFGSGYFPKLTKRAGLSGYFTVAASLKDLYEAHFGRGRALAAKRDHRQAVDAYQAAARLKSNNAQCNHFGRTRARRLICCSITILAGMTV